MDFFDPYASGSDDEAEIDSLLLQSCTNTLAGTEEGEHKKKNLRSSVLKGVEDHLVEYKHEDGTVTREEFVPVVAPPSVMINTTNENETDDKPKVKLKNRRYYDEEDLSIICYNCGNAGHTRFECIEEAKEPKCRECGELGHIKTKCPNRLCYNCLKRGHTSRNCTKPKVKVCFRCNGEGHSASQCRANLEYVPEKRVPVLYTVGRGTGSYFCFNCGLEGHTGKECSEPTMNEIHRYSFRSDRDYRTPPRKRRR
mmetsp:Transcript_16736/g.21332  ORF Transcript_16736/g.21332 Transcript_16736/m.21332 type:complete len:254 (-) Transcript_16736:147-908(-)